jgi:hypothetical protein
MMLSLCSNGGSSTPSSSYLLPIGVGDGDDVVALLQWRQFHAVVVLGRWADIAAVASIFQLPIKNDVNILTICTVRQSKEKRV